MALKGPYGKVGCDSVFCDANLEFRVGIGYCHSKTDFHDVCISTARQNEWAVTIDGNQARFYCQDCVKDLNIKDDY